MAKSKEIEKEIETEKEIEKEIEKESTAPVATPTPLMGTPKPIQPVQSFDNKPFEAISAQFAEINKKLDAFITKGPEEKPAPAAPPARTAKLFDEFDPTLGV
jgi:hypothetical protein